MDINKNAHDTNFISLGYRNDTEPLYHPFMYSLVSLLSGIYPLPAMHSLLVTLYVTEHLIGIKQRVTYFRVTSI